MQIKVEDYALFEAKALGAGPAKAPGDGVEERADLVNALVLEIEQTGNIEDAAKRAQSRFRAVVYRHAEGTLEALAVNAVSLAMVVVALMWVNAQRKVQMDAEGTGAGNDA